MERIDLPTIVGEMKIKDYGVFRRRVMDECGISRTTFYQWRCGRCVPGKAATHIDNRNTKATENQLLFL